MPFRVLADVRYSARSLARTPGMALALLFSIALGIGGNAVVYGFIQGLTSGKVPLTVSRGMVSLFSSDLRRASGSISYGEYLRLRKHTEAFEWIGAARVTQNDVLLAGRTTVVSTAAITPELAQLFGIPAPNGAVISRRVWGNDFGSQADLSHEQIRIQNRQQKISGIAPDWLEGLYADRPIDVWLPLPEGAFQQQDQGVRNIWALARLRAGVSASQAAALIHASAPSILVAPYASTTPEMHDSLARIGTLLRVAAGFVFFIACANVASFLLSRSTTRMQETSTRIAIGASRGLLSQAMLSDSIVIAFSGGALGIVLAFWISKIVPAFLTEQDAGLLVLAPDIPSIVLSSLAGMAVVIACGLLPIFETPYDRPFMVLRREGAGPSQTSRIIRAGLVIAQMACCCLLIIATGFLYQTFRSALKTGVSHKLGNPILASVQASPEAGMGYFRDVDRVARGMPGVAGVSWTTRLPGSRPAWQTFRVEPRKWPLREARLDIAAFTSDSVSKFALPPKTGRLFGDQDQACRAGVINEEASQALLGADTVGRLLFDASGAPIEVIGIVSPRTADSSRKTRPTIYYDLTNRVGERFTPVALAAFRSPVQAKLNTAELDANIVSPSYFDATGFSVVAGRAFADAAQAHGCRVAVVNQEAAELYFGGDALGAAVIDEMGRRSTIVAVVESARLGAFQGRVEPAVYFPMAQDYLPRLTAVLALQNGSGPSVTEVYNTLLTVPGRGPAPLVVKTFDEHLKQTALAPLSISAAIMAVSTAAGLILSVLGLYGALSDAARQRGREIAVRIALGARRRDLIWQILQGGARLAGWGALAGMTAALALPRVLHQFAPKAAMPGVLVWIAGPLLLAAAVAIASVLPARRSFMVDPINALRGEN